MKAANVARLSIVQSPLLLHYNSYWQYHIARSLQFRGGGVTPCDGLYVEAQPQRGALFRPQVYERAGISLVEV